MTRNEHFEEIRKKLTCDDSVTEGCQLMLNALDIKIESIDDCAISLLFFMKWFTTIGSQVQPRLYPVPLEFDLLQRLSDKLTELANFLSEQMEKEGDRIRVSLKTAQAVQIKGHVFQLMGRVYTKVGEYFVGLSDLMSKTLEKCEPPQAAADDADDVPKSGNTEIIEEAVEELEVVNDA